MTRPVKRPAKRVAFEAVGAVARWRVIYDLVRPLAPESVVTHEEMADALGLDAAEQKELIRGAARRAFQELEREDHRAVQAVRGIGYRVVQPEAHLALARQHQRKSLRSLNRGRSKVVNVDLSGVDPEVRAAFDTMAQAFSLQNEFIRRLDVRQKKLSQALAHVAAKQAHAADEQARTADEVAELKARMDRLMSQLPDRS